MSAPARLPIASALAILLIASPVSAEAQDATAQGLVSAVLGWEAQHKLAKGAVVVMRGGEIVATGSMGSGDPAAPARFASLSKSITAICAAQLVAAERLTLETPVGAVLGETLDAIAAGTGVADITLGQLLSQSSGLANDPAQGEAMLAFAPFDEPRLEEQAEIGLTQEVGEKVYGYNNLNYVLVGRMIEAVAQEPYQDYCSREVLTPLGIEDASLAPGWQALSAFGGWQMSTLSFARFLDYYDPAKGLLPIPVDQWPAAEVGGGASYGLGALYRQAGTGYNIWNIGAWTFDSDAGSASFGAYFAVLDPDLRVVVTFEPALDDAARAALDQAIGQALTP